MRRFLESPMTRIYTIRRIHTIRWLKRWSRYYRTIATSEMASHRFLSSNFRQQRIEFANGAMAGFDMAANLFRIKGIPGFSGEWESPYPI